jgi:hypothetical protein
MLRRYQFYSISEVADTEGGPDRLLLVGISTQHLFIHTTPSLLVESLAL